MSRAGIALTHFAGRAGDHNDRAMAGSPSLSAELATRLSAATTVIGAPRPALNTDWATELDAARPALLKLSDRYAQVLDEGLEPVTVLSRCAVALATLPVVVSHRPDAVVVWFDAHGDINTPASTTTGYLGGLALSGPLGLWDSGLGSGLADASTILAGARDLDPPERDLIERRHIRLLGPGPNLAADLAEAVAGRPAYVHLDCDVLEPGPRPARCSTWRSPCSTRSATTRRARREASRGTPRAPRARPPLVAQRSPWPVGHMTVCPRLSATAERYGLPGPAGHPEPPARHRRGARCPSGT